MRHLRRVSADPGRHVCAPVCKVTDADCPDYWAEVRAGHPEDAARKFASTEHAAWDYPREMTLLVRKPGSDMASRYEITVEMEPHFRARQTGAVIIEQDREG